jgi:Rho family protein
MEHFCEGVPLVLVCTKTDLRGDATTQSLMAAQGVGPITRAEGEKAAKEIGARQYAECSAKEGTGVGEVFKIAVREGLRKSGPRIVGAIKKKNCVIV